MVLGGVVQEFGVGVSPSQELRLRLGLAARPSESMSVSSRGRLPNRPGTQSISLHSGSW